MKFWDSSAVVPLLVNEESTRRMRSLVGTGNDLTVWAMTPVETLSALWRRRRAGEVDAHGLAAASASLAELEGVWSVVVDLERVEQRARRLLGLHSLRAADALQLAAALVACRDEVRLLPFVTLDERLAEAAMAQGFAVLG